jgi:hypothetical protein
MRLPVKSVSLVWTFATGAVVLTLFSLALFWLHPVVLVVVGGNLPWTKAESVDVSPSGFTAGEPAALPGSQPPTVRKPSHIVAHIGPESAMLPRLAEPLRPFADKAAETWSPHRPLVLRVDFRPDSDSPLWGERSEPLTELIRPGWIVVQFHRRSGLCVLTLFKDVRETKVPKYAAVARWYAGPEGFSSDGAGESLGRFKQARFVPFRQPGTPWLVLAYDAGLRRFFRLDCRSREVVVGPELPEDFVPADIGRIRKNSDAISGPRWLSETVEAAVDYGPEDAPHHSGTVSSRPHHFYRDGQYYASWRPEHRVRKLVSPPIVLVLGRDGTIRLLDAVGEDLALGPPTGFLPRPLELGAGTKARPDQLLAYNVEQFVIDGAYVGYAVATLGRSGTGHAAATFDPNNKYLSSDRKEVNVVEERGGLATILLDGLLVNLHPLALNVASYFALPYVDAGEGARGIFIRPNSLVATKPQHGRRDLGLVGGLFTALVMLIPAIVMSIFLAQRINADGGRLGLSKPVRQLWILATVAFGLPAYITYRLTRPPGSLVTCVNCGRQRWPDGVACHFCGSPWRVPELNPPAWRVLDGAEAAVATVSAKTNQEPPKEVPDGTAVD